MNIIYYILSIFSESTSIFLKAKRMYNDVSLIHLGDCSEQKHISKDQCKFTHYWHEDSENLLDEKSVNLVNGVEAGVKAVIKFWAVKLIAVVFVSIILAVILVKLCRSPVKTKKS